MLAAQAGKLVELFRIRNPTEAKKKLKRRVKRMREKEGGKESGKEGGKEGGKGGKSTAITSFSAWDDSVAPLGTANTSTLASDGHRDPDSYDLAGSLLSPHELCLSDELETHGVIRAAQKIRGCVFHPLGSA